jgi:hypothetical protein
MKASETGHPRKSSKMPAHESLTATHFVERLPPSQKKAKPTKRCAVCCKWGGGHNFILVQGLQSRFVL